MPALKTLSPMMRWICWPCDMAARQGFSASNSWRFREPIFRAIGWFGDALDANERSAIDATLERQIFYLPRRERMTDAHHHREADYLR